MTLEQLRIFATVAHEEHVSRAARRLNLTQSAASGAIQALEARHGVQLFDRIGRGVRLNAAGRAFLAEAEAVLTRAQAAQAALEDLSNLRRGRLGIVATPTIANYWLPTRLVAFRSLHPGVELDLRIADTAAVSRAVTEGEAELGFTGVRPEDPALSSRAVGRDQLILLTAVGHAWRRRSGLSAVDLMSETWIMREPASGTRESLEEALRQAGVRPDTLSVGLTLRSDEAVLAAVEAGGGISALSEVIVRPAIKAGRLAAGPLALPARSFFLVQRREAYQTRAAEAFAARLN